MTHALSAAAILDLWDQGQARPPAEQALLLLAAADAGQTFDGLAALSIGRRNARLLRLRRASFGEALECRARCPACGEALEFGVAVGDLLLPDAPDEGPFALRLGDLTALARLPTSADLLALGQTADAATARRALLERCLLRADVAGDLLDAGALPEETVAALAQAIAARDPQADMLLAMTCPACGAQWNAPFDIAAFVWQELGAHAERLLREVHTLAGRYGWDEARILALPAVRRQRYLALIEGD